MIRIPQVRVVDEEGAQLGVMPTPQALEMAQERGLDLVEVAPMASPPVVKFLDFGQYKYDLTKREKEAKRKQRSVTFKEVRLSPKIGVGDFDTKVHRAIEFLEDGDRIKVTVRFRGRELTHPELGRNLLAKFVDRVKDHGVAGADAAPRRQVDAHHDGIGPQAEDARSTDRHEAESQNGRAEAEYRQQLHGTDRPRGGSADRSSPAAAPAEVTAPAATRLRRPTQPPNRRPPKRLRPRPAEPRAAARQPPQPRSPGNDKDSARPPSRERKPATSTKQRPRRHYAGSRAGDVRRVRPGCPRSRATRRPRSASA